MPERFTASVPFKINGQDWVQIGDAWKCLWCLVPHNQGLTQHVLDALNLWDASQKSAPKVAKTLGEEVPNV